MENKNSNNNEEEFSREKGNLEVEDASVSPSLIREKEEAVEIARDHIDVRKGGSIVIGTMNVVVEPVRKHLKKRHELFYKKSKFHLAADIVFVLAILGSIGLFLFIRNLEPKAEISLGASLADDRGTSGQAETFEIAYKNNGKVDISDVSLSVNLPKNFILLSVSPENTWSDQTNTFRLEDLERGANGQVKITGVIYGEVGSREVLAYSLNYLQNGHKANTLGSFVFPIEDSSLSANLSLPSEIYQDVDFGGKIALKNSGRADIEKGIELTFNDTPIILKNISAEKASLNNNVITLDGLKAGEMAEIEFEASTEEAKELNFDFSANLNLDGRPVEQQSYKKKIMVYAPKLKLSLAADKKTIKNEETVSFKLDFSNEEESDLSEVAFSILPADSAVAIKSLLLKEGADKYKDNGGNIQIGDLKKSEKGVIGFEASLSRKKPNIDQEAGVSILVSYKTKDKTVEYRVYSPKIKFLSDLQASSRGVYYSAQGDQLGIGPLPPVVDVPTSYWVFWQVDNLGSDLKDFVLSAELPANVIWTDNKSLLAGKLRYGEIGRKVVWTIDSVAASDGQYRAGFEVQLIPVKADLGKTPNLLVKTAYSATDIFANAEISGELPNITTDLPDDRLAAGKGKVVQMEIVR